MNYTVKTDLMRLPGAFLLNIQGKTAVKKCLCLPVDDAHLFVGTKGCYLDLTCWESPSNQYGDTHLIKQSLPKAVREQMGDDQLKAQPILGNMRPMEAQRTAYDPAAQPAVESADELPF